jgi:hypothetical protein
MRSDQVRLYILLFGLAVGVAAVYFLVGTITSRRSRNNISIRTIVRWGRSVDAAIAQITKAYEWRIQQWTSCGTAILTAALGFISAVAVSSFKEELRMNSWIVASIVSLALLASLCSYAICQQRITRLKDEYLRLYSLLLFIKNRKRFP